MLGDALTTDFCVEIHPARQARLAANLPYNISTAILQRLILQRECIIEMIVMLQREVVDRVLAPPGSSERGFLSVIVEAYAETEKLFDVAPGAFRPPPKVWSSVMRLTFKPRIVTNADLFWETVSAGFAQKIDSVKPYLRPGLASSDSTQRLAASVIMLTAGSKLAQAAAYNAAYPWLDTLLQVTAPRTSADTVGPRQQVRVNGSFWYGLSSVLTLQAPYKHMTEVKGAARCPTARDVFDRLTRTKNALMLGRRVHPPTADQMLGFVAQYEKAKPQVQKAYQCKPALS